MFQFIVSCAAFLLIVLVPLSTAQSDQDCPTIVHQALETTSQVCEATGRNQACYGYNEVEVTPHPGINDFHFQQPGDTAAVDKIRSLELSSLETDKDLWGIALMRLQADLPQSNPGNITLLVFGNVQLENAVPQHTLLDATVTTTANMRALPNTGSEVMATLPANTVVAALERLTGNNWYRVQLPDSEQVGWVTAEALSIQGDVATLDVATPSQPNFQPMQAFYFRADSAQPTCSEAPRSGLLIQTPEGAGEIRLWINEVQIHLGSTVYFEAQPGEQMTVTTLEGHARVETMGISHTAFAGSSVSVLLNEDMKPAAPPSTAFAYDASQLQNLPIGLLQRPITIHLPLTAEELSVGLQNEALPVASDNTVTSTSVQIQPVSQVNQSVQPTQQPAQSSDCPGNSCHDQCPGNSCNSNGVGNPNHSGSSDENQSNEDNGNRGNGNGNSNNNVEDKHGNKHGNGG